MESNLNVLIKEKKLEIVEYVTTTLVPLIVGDYRMAISLDDAINEWEWVWLCGNYEMALRLL
nr:hypothetical protein [Providencia alcalifaciens]